MGEARSVRAWQWHEEDSRAGQRLTVLHEEFASCWLPSSSAAPVPPLGQHEVGTARGKDNARRGKHEARTTRGEVTDASVRAKRSATRRWCSARRGTLAPPRVPRCTPCATAARSSKEVRQVRHLWQLWELVLDSYPARKFETGHLATFYGCEVAGFTFSLKPATSHP